MKSLREVFCIVFIMALSPVVTPTLLDWTGGSVFTTSCFLCYMMWWLHWMIGFAKGEKT